MKNSKKYILSFLLGALIAGVAVYAASYSARDIIFESKYDNFTANNVEDAVNELYDNGNDGNYEGSYHIVPDFTSQTLDTSNKMMTEDLVIEAIPSEYKYLSSVSTVNATNLFDGVTAYNSSGKLITGTALNCIKGTLSSGVCGSSSDAKVVEGYTHLFMFNTTGDKSIEVNTLNNYVRVNGGNASKANISTFTNSTFFSLSNGTLYCKNFTSEWASNNYIYFACK